MMSVWRVLQLGIGLSESAAGVELDAGTERTDSLFAVAVPTLVRDPRSSRPGAGRTQ